jgi:uncharacterized paraquat-inducible protein A
MYCSTCGVAADRGLSYCKHCGAKLNEGKETGNGQVSQITPDALIWAIVAVFVVGLGCTIGLMAVMKEVVHFNDGIIGAFTLASFVLMILLEVVFVSLLFRRNRTPKEKKDTAPMRESLPQDGPQARALPDVAPSVTEHTTRNFEPIYHEPKTK